jgi:polysaccharide chain length determinant protein (PEP-CTERM system associated)
MKLDLKYYFSIFWRRFPYFLVVALLVSAIGASLAMVLPAKYRAEALLLVESEQIPDELASSTVTTGASEQLQIIEKRLTTRANILDIVNRLHIYDTTHDMNPTEIVDDMRERTQIKLLGGGRRGGATTVTVSFDADTPAMSALVANEFVTLILEENVKLRSGSAAQTMEFFTQEVSRLGLEIDKQNAKILAFKMSNQNALPDSLDYRRTRQTALQERLLQLQRDDAVLGDRRARFVEFYQRTGRVESVEGQVSVEQKQLNDLRRQLDEALSIYASNNPRVKILQSRVDALEATVSDQLPSEASEQNKAMSLYDLQLSDIDGQIKYIREQKALVEDELKQLADSIQKTPGNSIKLSELERDYENTQNQYNQAVSRRSAAEVGERIEVLSKGQRISIIEQAVVPVEPYSPNRRKIVAISILGGVGLGFGLIFLLEFLNRSIRRPVDITNQLGIAPIATLPYIFTGRQLMTRWAILTSVVLIILVGVPAGVWSLHTYYLPMDLLIQKVIDKSGLDPILKQIQISVPK